MLTVLDLFSGIGGFSLGLERTGGFKTVAFCEIDPFCRKVLAKHWPGVPCFDDITTAQFSPGYADVICGGFPCQDISTAGKRAGITGERSGLWKYLVGAIRVVRPRYAVMENVSALLGNGLDVVLGDLAAIGYDAEWHCIPASAVGAPHRRDRIWIAAYPGGQQHESGGSQEWRSLASRLHEALANPTCERCREAREYSERSAERLAGGGEVLADADSARFPNREGGGKNEELDGQRAADNAGCDCGGRHQWSPEPDVGRVAHGVPSRVDRLRGLGNAVVPQIPELIGRAILKAEGLEP